MRLIRCYLTNSDCYKRTSSSAKTGIVVHSTGANNPNISRYVQPMASDSNYTEMINTLGKNQYGNDWNHVSRDAGVHAFVGCLKGDKSVLAVCETLPYEKNAWGVGKGTKGSFNYAPTARIQFEICEDDLTNSTYFYAVMKEAQEYCAYLCNRYGWGVDKICSHAESYKLGYGGNHGDPDHWLKRYGKDMNWFRSQVQIYLNKLKNPTPASAPAPAKTKTHAEEINDIVWELAKRDIISDKTYWLEKLKEDGNVFWLAKKTVAYLGKAKV